MAGINLSMDASDLERAQIYLRGIKGALPKVMERSLNKAIRGVRTDTSKEIRREVTAKAKHVNRTFKIYKASAKKGILAAALESTGKRLPMIAYQARQTKRGVSVKINRQGGRHLIPHAFIATMPSGHTGVFQREIRHQDRGRFGTIPVQADKREDKQFAKMPRKYQLPITELYSPSVPQVFKRPEVMRSIERKGQVRLKKAFEQELRFALLKAGRTVEEV